MRLVDFGEMQSVQDAQIQQMQRTVKKAMEYEISV
jgi:hypothetical protein